MDIDLNRTLAITVVFHNQGIIVFANGKIVHPNENTLTEVTGPQTALLSEITALALVIEAASSIGDTNARTVIHNSAAKAIHAKAQELVRIQ